MNTPALVGLRGVELSSEEAALLRELRPLGALIFRRNVEDREQLRRLCDDLRSELGDRFWIAADQEGGAVSVLQDALPPSPSALAMGLAGDPNWTRVAHWQLAQEARSVGIDLLLAPVADVVGGEHAVLATRSFGSDPAEVARQVVAAVEGIQSAGVRACVKHWPGHGRPIADSHLELPTVDATLEQLIACELIPFAAALEARVASVMVGHLRVPAMDASAQVASASRVIVQDWLRRRLGFEGLILADALEMEASSDPAAQLRAGCDAVLVARPVERARDLLASLPPATDEACERLRAIESAAMFPDATGVRERIRGAALLALWEEFQSMRAWPPFGDSMPTVVVFDAASSDRLVREPAGDGDSLRPAVPVVRSLFAGWLQARGIPVEMPVALVAPAAEAALWLAAIDELPLERADLLVIAGLRPWPAEARSALRRRMAGSDRPPCVLILGDPSPQAWLGDQVPLLLCPGLQEEDLHCALDALHGRVELRPRDRWGF